MKPTVIAFDGPAGSGKTTISQELSKLVNIPCLNTGNMYRSVAYIALIENITNVDDLCHRVQELEFDFVLKNTTYQLRIDGKNLSESISSPEILLETSKIARYSEVRKVLTLKQQELISQSDLIVEGRDIGTVVAPEAEYKFFIDADIEIRAKRLFSMLTVEERAKTSFEEFQSKIISIDNRDKIYDVLHDANYIHIMTGNFSSAYEAKKIFEKYLYNLRL